MQNALVIAFSCSYPTRTVQNTNITMVLSNSKAFQINYLTKLTYNNNSSFRKAKALNVFRFCLDLTKYGFGTEMQTDVSVRSCYIYPNASSACQQSYARLRPLSFLFRLNSEEPRLSSD